MRTRRPLWKEHPTYQMCTIQSLPSCCRKAIWEFQQNPEAKRIAHRCNGEILCYDMTANEWFKIGLS